MYYFRKTAKYSANQIANFFIEKGIEAGDKTLTNLKIQKLVYIAHGWHLAITGDALIQEEIEAWPFGPVIPKLYHELKRYRQGAITQQIVEFSFESLEERMYNGKPDYTIPSIDWNDDEVRQLLEKIWSIYGDKDGYYLTALTHKDATPWTETWNMRGNPIANSKIQKHYEDLFKQYTASK